MNSQEFGTRVTTLARRAVRRLAALGRRNKWRRGELASRLAAADPSLQAAVNRLADRDWMGAHHELMRHFQSRASRFPIDPASRRTIVSAVTTRFPAACEDAERRADFILAGRYDLLGYTNLEFTSRSTPAGDATSTPPGVDIDWKFDPVHRRKTADGWWSDLDYLDPANGDHKIVWELNRHQHWLTLGRAYWLLGREHDRSRFVDELESWLAQNPPLSGVNWASMLELALRGLSWVWALHFFLDDPYDLSKPERDVPWLVDLLLGLERQMRHVEENLSHCFSPSTHLTGEALGLYVTGRVLPELRASHRWETAGRQVLIEQAAKQIAPDGGHLERSTHYHRYTLDFYLLALAIARRTGDAAAAAAFEPVVARLARFAWAMADANGRLPRIGDDDAGVLWRLGGDDPADVRASLSIAASLLPGHVPVEEFSEESIWVGGAGGIPPTATNTCPGGPHTGSHRATAEQWDRSTAFPATGYYVSRSRSGDHLVFDAGPHGFLEGGHAHADALALTLSLRWHPFLIDAGTGTYTMDAAMRDRFRSTALHNTLVLDGLSQSRADGPFHWAAAANGRAVRWASNSRFDFVEGLHDGYGPATHRRAVFSAGGDLWLVADHVLGRGSHTAAVHWHLDPDWNVRVEPTGVEARHADPPSLACARGEAPRGPAVAAPIVECAAEAGGIRAVLASTARRLEIFRGDDETGLGWCSPAYGRVVPCPAVRFARSGDVPFSVATIVVPAQDARGVAIETIPARGGSPDAYGFAVRVSRPDAVNVALFVVPPDVTARIAMSSGRFPGGTWQFGGFETDARFCCVRLGPTGAVQAVSLVDGTFVQRVSDDPFRLQIAHAVRDVAISLEPDGLLEIFSSAPLPSLGVDAPARVVNRVRMNDFPLSFRRSGAAVVVPAGQAAAADSRPAETPVGAVIK